MVKESQTKTARRRLKTRCTAQEKMNKKYRNVVVQKTLSKYFEEKQIHTDEQEFTVLPVLEQENIVIAIDQATFYSFPTCRL